MARKIIPQEFSAGNGTGNRTRNYLDGPKNNSPIIFGRRVIVLTPTVPLRGFRRPSRRPSVRQIFLSETLGPVAPNRVAP